MMLQKDVASLLEKETQSAECSLLYELQVTI